MKFGDYVRITLRSHEGDRSHSSLVRAKAQYQAPPPIHLSHWFFLVVHTFINFWRRLPVSEHTILSLRALLDMQLLILVKQVLRYDVNRKGSIRRQTHMMLPRLIVPDH